MTILVTGAGGQLGHLVVDHLIARGTSAGDIVAGARTTEKASDLAERGVRVVPLDYEDADSVQAALDGVDTVVLVSGSEVGRRAAQHRAVIDAAVSAGVGSLIYTSLLNATTSSSPLAPEHVETEEMIAASGLSATILRNGWYAENYVANLDAVRATGELVGNAGGGKVAAAARNDFAEAAAVVALGEGHGGQTYELAGDALTFDEIATAMGEVVGRAVTYRSVSADEHTEILTDAGLDAGTISFLTAVDTGIADGDLDSSSDDLAVLIGRPTTPLEDALRAAV